MRQLFEYHPVIGYRFIPGLKARVPHEGGGYLLRANGLGFRCRHEFVQAKPPGRRRILLFGNSFTAGEGVSDGKRYGDLLEQLIPDLEVYNLAMPGTGTDQHYLIYQEFAAGIEHDLLVLAVLVENILRVKARYRVYYDDRGERVCYGKPYFELEEGELVLKQVPPPKEPLKCSEIPKELRHTVDRGGRYYALRRFLKKFKLQRLAQRVTRYQPFPEYNRPGDPAWLLMRAILTRWITNHPGKVLIVPIPFYQYLEETSDPSAYQARFRELAEATGALLYDPLPDLRQYPLEERRHFRFAADPHLTAAGHQALAQSLAPVIGRVLGQGSQSA
jgi:lysophospholipase L1-like esterase